MIQIRRVELIALGLLCLSAGFAVGFLLGNPAMDNSKDPNADWTIAKCELWASNPPTSVEPILPPYTVQNVCIQDDGALSVAP